MFIGIGQGYYQSQGLYQIAEKWLNQGYEVILNHPNKYILSIVIIINSLGEILNIQGKYKKAELLYKQALEIGNDLGKEHYMAVKYAKSLKIQKSLQNVVAKRK